MRDLFIGVNALIIGLPGLPAEFVAGFERLARSRRRRDPKARTSPSTLLQHLTKADIARRPTGSGWTRRSATAAMTRCRTVAGCATLAGFVPKGFADAGLPDPTHYAAAP